MKLYGKEDNNIPEHALTLKDFDMDGYRAVDLYFTDKGTPAVVFQADNLSEYSYKVMYDSSELFFTTLKDAVAYCKARFRPSVRKNGRPGKR